MKISRQQHAENVKTFLENFPLSMENSQTPTQNFQITPNGKCQEHSRKIFIFFFFFE